MFEDVQKEEGINKDNNLEEEKVKKLVPKKIKEKKGSKLISDYKNKLSNFENSVNDSVNSDDQQFKNQTVKTRFSLVKILIIFLVILILVGGVWFYYAQGEVMLLSNQMKWGWGAETDSFYTESNLFLEFRDIDLKNQSDGFLMMGNIPQTLQLSSDFSFKVIKEDGEGFIDLKLDIGPRLNLNLDFKKINHSFYLKPRITGLNEIVPFLDLPDIDAQEEWILINAMDGDIPFYNFDLEQSDSLMEKLQDKIPILLNNLKKKNIFIIKDPHQIKNLEGFKLKKIDYFIKESKIDDFVFLAIDSFSKNEDEAYQKKEEFIKNKQEKPEEWHNVKKFIQDLKISLWIDKNNKFIKGFDLELNNFEINTNDIGMTIGLKFDNLVVDAESVEILIPDNYISAEEFLERIQNNLGFNQNPIMLNSLKMEGAILNNEDSDGDGLLDYIEQALGTDINNQDTDGDGYLDKEEIENGYNPLEVGGEKLDPEILNFYQQIIEEEKISIPDIPPRSPSSSSILPPEISNLSTVGKEE